MVRQLICPPIQFSVRDLFAFDGNGYGIRTALHLFLEELMNA
jgi:hypothetical protein